MKKWSICKLAVILILSTQNKIAAQELELLKTTHLPNYPSTSAIEFYKNRLYIVGDDAANLMILDTAYQVLDSIALFSSLEKRIAKDEKADIEASAIVTEKEKDYLVLLSSFSTGKRDKMVVLNLNDKKSEVHINDSKQPRAEVEELNIEGAAFIKNQLLLSNRANNTHKENHLILSELDLKNGVTGKKQRTINFVFPETGQVNGISGLTYLAAKDLLLFTASTESTSNAHSDGAIGESYVGYVVDASKKIDQDSIKVDKLIPLSKIFTDKKAQKIEAIAVEENMGDALILHLAADNDNGESTLFKLRLNWNNKNPKRITSLVKPYPAIRFRCLKNSFCRR